MLLVVGKMKDQTADLTIKISVGLKPRLFQQMIPVNKKNKRYVNKNVIAKVSHNKYKDVLQSKKSFGGFGKKKGGGGGGGGGF